MSIVNMSTVTVNGSVEERIMENAESTGRDIRNHMLFEVSTEAANRGIYCCRDLI